jgi:hypothetical protein
MAAQECDTDFVSSGNTVIDGPLLKWYQDTFVSTPIETRYNGDMHIWQMPDYTKSYIISADVSRGDSGDFSTFHVLDVESLEQVAEYKGMIGTKDYGNLLVNVATEYNDALLVIENSNVGWAAIQPAIDREYRNLYYTYKSEGYLDTSVMLAKGYDMKDKTDMVPGFTTSGKTRPLIISKLITLMNEKSPIIHGNRLIDELYVFIWKGSRPEAQQGYNDDLVMAFAIGLWVRDTALKLKQQGISLTKQTLSHMSRNKGIYNTSMVNKKDTGWTQQIRGNDEDLTWLIK